jgi:hypothetical protein
MISRLNKISKVRVVDGDNSVIVIKAAMGAAMHESVSRLGLQISTMNYIPRNIAQIISRGIS